MAVATATTPHNHGRPRTSPDQQTALDLRKKQVKARAAHYVVAAGATPVLVHNCDPSVDDVFARTAKIGNSSGEYPYRGITNNHFKFAEARAGISKPLGGHSQPIAHSDGNTHSVFTSWSPDLDTAREFSEKFGSPGS